MHLKKRRAQQVISIKLSTRTTTLSTMANVSYTCKYVSTICVADSDIISLNRLKENIATLANNLREQEEVFRRCYSEMMAAQIGCACIRANLDNAKKTYLELLGRVFQDAVSEDEVDIVSEDDDEEEVDSWEDHDDDDFGCILRPRKTKANILTPEEAIKAGKASKQHKLAPKKPKRDHTKTPEARDHSKNNRNCKRKLSFA